MKKVVFVISNLAVGGAQRMLAELICKIDRSRFDIEVLCSSDKRNTHIESIIEKECPVTYIHTKRMGIVSVIRLVRTLLRMKPDVVHSHLGSVSYAMIWSLLTHKLLVFTAHSAPERVFRKKNLFLFRRIKGKINMIMAAVSEENAKKCRAYFDLDAEHCVCINNGVDLSRFCRTEHEGFTYINVASQNENKNQSLILRCFKRIHELYPDTKLVLVGDGPLHDRLAELAEELDLRDDVLLPGCVSDVQSYLAHSDCYVQSSHTEAMPMSVIEAMAAGLPVVSTAAGGIRDIMHDSGYLIADGDEDAFFEAMKKVYDAQGTQWESMSGNARRAVRDFSGERMAEQYMSIYEEKVNVR